MLLYDAYTSGHKLLSKSLDVFDRRVEDVLPLPKNQEVLGEDDLFGRPNLERVKSSVNHVILLPPWLP